MIFEWDPLKAESNLKKHGIGFEEAATVFLDPNGLEIEDWKHTTPAEKRGIRLGISLYSRILMVVFTERRRANEKENIRIISARKANKGEKALYDG